MKLMELSENIKVINEQDDLLNSIEKANAITGFINDNREYLRENNLIAIYGKWGSGKSCLMKTIENKLDKNKYKTIWFNTWMYEKDNNLPFSLLKYILKNRKIKNALDTGKKVFESLAYSTEFNVGPVTINTKDAVDFANKIDAKVLWEEVEDFKKEYKKIKFQGKTLVVFLDDLDRCDSENIIALISSIKHFLSINENIVFIIGIDRRAVTLALQNKYNNDFNKADEYLEKIFPINFLITSGIVYNEKNISWISKVLDLDVEKSRMIMNFLEKIEFTNPRRLKKVFRKFISIKNYLNNKEIELNNEKTIIFILYTIILALFYENEFLEILADSKESYYFNIQFKINSKGTIYTFPYTNKVDIYDISQNNNRSTTVFAFIEKFSSIYPTKNELEIIDKTDRAIIQIDSWQALFKDSICKRFVKYVYESKEICNWLQTQDQDSYGIKYINRIIKACNDVI